MTIGNKIAGVVIILLGIFGAIIRAVLTGYHHVLDYVMLAVFIITVFLGISVLKRK